MTIPDFTLKCRSCGNTDAALLLDLGQQPLANNLLTHAYLAKREPKVPLRLAVCKACWMLQITDLVPPVELFSEYLYFSSFSTLCCATRAKRAMETGGNSDWTAKASSSK